MLSLKQYSTSSLPRRQAAPYMTYSTTKRYRVVRVKAAATVEKRSEKPKPEDPSQSSAAATDSVSKDKGYKDAMMIQCKPAAQASGLLTTTSASLLHVIMCVRCCAAFGWDSCQKGGWYKHIQSKLDDLQVLQRRIILHQHHQLQQHSLMQLLGGLLQYATSCCTHLPFWCSKTGVFYHCSSQSSVDADPGALAAVVLWPYLIFVPAATAVLLQALTCTHLWLPPPSQSVSDQVTISAIVLSSMWHGRAVCLKGSSRHPS